MQKTIEELDAMSDDVVYDHAHGKLEEISLELDASQREAMNQAYAEWLETLDEDVREVFVETGDDLDDVGLYYTLRINGVDFERTAEAAPAFA